MAPSGSRKKLAAATTSASGTASLSAPATETAHLQVVFPGDRDATASSADLGGMSEVRATTSTITVAATAGYDSAVTATGSLVWAQTTDPVTGAAVELWSAPASDHDRSDAIGFEDRIWAGGQNRFQSDGHENRYADR